MCGIAHATSAQLLAIGTQLFHSKHQEDIDDESGSNEHFTKLQKSVHCTIPERRVLGLPLTERCDADRLLRRSDYDGHPHLGKRNEAHDQSEREIRFPRRLVAQELAQDRMLPGKINEAHDQSEREIRFPRRLVAQELAQDRMLPVTSLSEFVLLQWFPRLHEFEV